MFQHIAGTTARRYPIIAVFGYLDSCTRGNKRGQGGNVEGVFPISTRTTQINGRKLTQIDGQTEFL